MEGSLVIGLRWFGEQLNQQQIGGVASQLLSSRQFGFIAPVKLTKRHGDGEAFGGKCEIARHQACNGQ
jgi:hypothetical protein